jgi:hypothetical protein
MPVLYALPLCFSTLFPSPPILTPGKDLWTEWRYRLIVVSVSIKEVHRRQTTDHRPPYISFLEEDAPYQHINIST